MGLEEYPWEKSTEEREISRPDMARNTLRQDRKPMLAILAFTFVLTSSYSPLSAQTGALAGHVIDAETNEPVAWATVVIDGFDRSRTSDELGYFFFATLPVGNYILQTLHVGYRDMRFEVDVIEADTSHVDLQIGQRAFVADETTVVSQHLHLVSPLEEPEIVFSGNKLRQNLGRTIAETIDYEPGIAQRSMGPAPSRPVLRGLGGDRLLMLEDGERTGDLSATSSDHAVAIEPMTTERIEVLRGPETMLYGSNALGGVVNVVRNYVPREHPKQLGGSFSWQGEGVNSGLSSGMLVQYGIGPFALRIDGSARTAGDVSTPRGRLRNTSIETNSAALGTSIMQPWGYIGAAVGSYNSEYGIPPDPIAGHPNGVAIDLQRRHIEVRGEWLRGTAWSERIRAHHVYSRYRHGEFEASGTLGMEYGLLTHNGGVQARLREVGEFKNGALGGWYEYRNYAAAGLNFTPDAEEYAAAAYLYQEWERRAWAANASLRLDARRVEPGQARYSRRVGQIETRDFSGISGGLSVQYSLKQHLVIGSTIMRTFRAPGIEELFTEGPHLAAYAYEVGNGSLDPERGLGTELFVDYHPAGGHVHLALFRNSIERYIFPKNTGKRSLRRADLFLYQTVGLRALMHGAELAIEKELGRRWQTLGTLSYVRGRLTNLEDESMPRLPPLQGRAGLTYKRDDAMQLSGGVRMAAAQKRLGPFENPTDAYIVLDFSGQYYIHWRGHLHTVAITLENASDAVYRKHLNRVKKILPEPGRNLRLLHKVFF